MFIVMVAPECAPAAKVGGLADVVYGLSRELEIRGNHVEIILPKYAGMRYDQIWALHVDYEDLWVPWGGGVIHCSVWFGFVHGRKVFFIDPHSDEAFFDRGGYYGFEDDPQRFAFFSKAALEFMVKTGKRPEIIHTHDWQTAAVPVLLYEMYQQAGLDTQRVCHTIHNFKHQGVTEPEVLWQMGLGRPEHLLSVERLGDDFSAFTVNLMKGGIVYANFVTTVSPTHAWEARYTDVGWGLGHTLYVHQDKFGGVLNGVDYEVWNPAIDPHLPVSYDVDHVEDKYASKAALRRRQWLRDDFKPIVAYVGRLDSQKGVHLIRHAIFSSLDQGAQFVLLGSSPDPGVNADFWRLKHELNESPDCHLELGFDDHLAHLMYAGADIMIVPSLFEPCGLTQMIAMKYGTVPVVRATGGLADTVFDHDFSDRPMHERNGYVFHEPDPPGIDSALHRAIGLWQVYPEAFRELMLNAMRYDYSWNYPAQHYLNIYDLIRHK